MEAGDRWYPLGEEGEGKERMVSGALLRPEWTAASWQKKVAWKGGLSPTRAHVVVLL
jgi:hypothetical protein